MNDSAEAVHSGTESSPKITDNSIENMNGGALIEQSSLLKNESALSVLRNWSVSTYKYTKQVMLEKIGKCTRTFDTELENQIDQLKETQKKYLSILKLSRVFSTHFYHCVQTQHALSDAFSDLAQKSPELQEEFLRNAETQRSLTKNGELLLNALNFFSSSVSTLCNKTIEDSMISIRKFETARIELDACRTDLLNSRSTNAGSVPDANIQAEYEKYKSNYENMRADIIVKMRLLDENRVKVMHKQLILLHNAVAAYYSGNAQLLESTLQQFNVKSQANGLCDSISPTSNKEWWAK